MNLSRYLLSFSCPGKPGHSLVFSTRKGSLALVPTPLLERLGEGQISPDRTDVLTRLGIAADDLEAERLQVLGYLDEVNRLDPGITVAVILGMECNFACLYCYEGNLKQKRAMARETADGLAAFASNRLVSGKTKLTFDFYGGEPLLYRERIRQIAGTLKPIAEQRGAAWSFTLVTNGSLLTPAVVEEFLPLGLSGAKVTLDGPAENHDRFRPFGSGKGSFAAVVENLRACADLVPIAVGGNYTAEDWRIFPRLLDYLEAEGLGPGRLAQVSFQPVIRTSDRFSNPEFSGGCASASEPWLAEASVVLRGEVLRRGYKTPKLTPTPCMIDLRDAFTVDWDGTLYKCPGMIGHPEFAVGDVREGFLDYQEVYGGRGWKDREDCQRCVYLPLCFGGCRYCLYERQGTMAGVDCRESLYAAALEGMVRQDAKYRYGIG